LYPGAGGFGHVGIGVNSSQTSGLYPADDADPVATATGQDVPGVVHPDTRVPEANVTIPTTPEQDAAVQAAIDARTADPGNYNLLNNNCSDFVQDALGAGGIGTSGTTFPRALMNELQGAAGGAGINQSTAGPQRPNQSSAPINMSVGP
jgi:hypothetical protein